jgi:hypothetical protein
LAGKVPTSALITFVGRQFKVKMLKHLYLCDVLCLVFSGVAPLIKAAVGYLNKRSVLG